MKILITSGPGENSYIEALIAEYKKFGNEVCCHVNNFYYSNYVPDVLHIHWPEELYKWNNLDKLDYSIACEKIKERLDWYKARDTTIVYTIHNLRPHEIENSNEKDIFNEIIKRSDIIVHHCKKSKEMFYDEYRKIVDSSQINENIICQHGDYLIDYKKIPKIESRKVYHIPTEKIVILNFGKQRPYKNERFIRNVYRKLARKNKYLLVAGEYQYPTDNRLEKMATRLRKMKKEYFAYKNEKYIYRHFEKSEIPQIMSCSDIAFIAQNHALNSGYLSLAATYSMPIVMPRIGCFKESVNGFVYQTYEPGDIKGAVKALEIAYDHVSQKKEINNRRWLDTHSWESHVKRIMKTVEKVKK